MVGNECAPSQPSAPPEPLQQPDYPFQQVASDYFQAGGYHYLVIVDRFSGWPTVQFCGASTGSSRQLQEWLRQFFATYGIPEELATDGGESPLSHWPLPTHVLTTSEVYAPWLVAAVGELMVTL